MRYVSMNSCEISVTQGQLDPNPTQQQGSQPVYPASSVGWGWLQQTVKELIPACVSHSGQQNASPKQEMMKAYPFSTIASCNWYSKASEKSTWWPVVNLHQINQLWLPSEFSHAQWNPPFHQYLCFKKLRKTCLRVKFAGSFVLFLLLFVLSLVTTPKYKMPP